MREGAINTVQVLGCYCRVYFSNLQGLSFGAMGLGITADLQTVSKLLVTANNNNNNNNNYCIPCAFISLKVFCAVSIQI